MPNSDNREIWEKVFTEKLGFFLAVAGFITIIGAVIAFMCFSSWSFSSTLDEAIVGQFGDFVGGVVGTLFALAGVVLYYVALTEQRKDLKINHDNLQIQTDALKQQIEEFKAQKEEMAETRKVYEEQTALFQEQTNLYREQSETMKKQAEEAKKQTSIYLAEQFDAGFYPLLNLICSAQLNYSDIIDNIISEIRSRIVKTDDINKTYDLILGEYIIQFQANGDRIGRLFDMITQLVRLINNAGMLDDEKKKHYINIFHSQLNENTKVVLFYHLCSEAGSIERSLYLQSGFFEKMNIMRRCELYPLDKGLKIGQFTEQLSTVIKKSLDKIMSLEELPDKTDEKINVMGVPAQSKLFLDDNVLHYSLSIQQVEWTKTGLDKNDFSHLLSFILYDVKYIRSFKLPIAGNVNSSIKESDEMVSFEYDIIVD